MAKDRIKIPRKVEDDVMFKSRGKCYCGKRGDEIHHIDGNPANNDFNNLVLICHDHHDDASVKNGLKKRLSPTQIKQRRNDLYAKNEVKSRIELKHYKSTLKKITQEDLYRAALDANIIVEIIKVSSEFHEERNWEKRSEIIRKLRKYSEHKSIRISNEVFEFLLDVSGYTRGGMTSDISGWILSIIIEFFPYSDNPKDKELIINIAETCGNIAFGISYDAFIHLGNLAVAESGLEILKYICNSSKALKIPEMRNITLHQYSELEETLQRPERNDLQNAKRLLKVYKNDIDTHGLMTPNDLPSDLFLLTMEHQKEAQQRNKHLRKSD
jgi:hypothetical protein